MPTKVHQGLLEKVVRKLFPSEELTKNARKASQIASATKGYYLELDIWLPNLHICFEFQDPYHYVETWDSHVPLHTIQEQTLIQRKETLITVPCWWNGDLASIAAEVKFLRPELLTGVKTNYKNLIPLNPPHHFYDFKLEGEIPDIGDLMLASFPSVVNFPSTLTPKTAWWMGEKYDGCRACWNPFQQSVYSRSGNIIQLPEIFLRNFPKTQFLDGELWFGRGDFIDSGRLSKEDAEIYWAGIRFLAFDNPNPRLQFLTFEKRYESVVNSFDKFHPFAVVAPRLLCTNPKQLVKTTQELIDEGGEGVILRLPNSSYERGRNKSLVKFKASREDKEALVIDFRGGSFLLQLPDSTSFWLPMSCVSSRVMPHIGDVVSYAFQRVSLRSLPVSPDLFRVRKDVTWRQVVADFESERQREAEATSLNKSSWKFFGEAPKPPGYWDDEAGKQKMRQILENFAFNILNIDPLVASEWYSVERKKFLVDKEVNTVLVKFGGSLIKSVISLFPELSIDKSKFLILHQNYWHSMENRRKFLEKFARLKGFDPLIPNNWYSVSQSDLLAVKGGRSMLNYYSNSPFLPIVHVFPEIGLDISKFASVPKFFWSEEKNRRNFFVQAAKDIGFDPLVAENWYTFPTGQLLKLKGISSIINFYNGSLMEAIVRLFPDVSFDTSKFGFRRYEKWTDLDKRRQFFINFANQLKFNPLLPHGWYQVTSAQILAAKGGDSVLIPYGGSFARALLHLFPSIGLDEKKLGRIPASHWKDPKNRRSYLEDLVKIKNLDPNDPETWYTFPRYIAKTRKYAPIILGFHGKSIVNAAMDLFPELNLDRSKFNGA